MDRLDIRLEVMEIRIYLTMFNRKIYRALADSVGLGLHIALDKVDDLIFKFAPGLVNE